MKDVLILTIPLAGILAATYLMLQHFHNKSIKENEKEIDIQKTKTFFPLQIQDIIFPSLKSQVIF